MLSLDFSEDFFLLLGWGVADAGMGIMGGFPCAINASMNFMEDSRIMEDDLVQDAENDTHLHDYNMQTVTWICPAF